MEVSPQSPALLLAREHEPLVRSRQIVPQSQGVDRRPGLPGEVLQETLLVGPEATFAGADPEHEPAHRLRPVGERQGRDVRLA